jgi:hypothetical protein
MCFHINNALVVFELTCTTACTGITAKGGTKEAIIATIIAPPPNPKDAETTEVKKLAKQSSINAQSSTPGALFMMV